jgi:hypothetical protein
VRRRHASHITVVLSKAAHSGPSVCLRARAPCPLRVSCPGTDRAERAAQAAGVSVQPSCRRERAVQTAGSCASVPPLVKTKKKGIFGYKRFRVPVDKASLFKFHVVECSTR